MKANKYKAMFVIAAALTVMAGCSSDSDSSVPFLSVESNQSADIVIGQVDFNSSQSSPTAANSMYAPYGNAMVYNGHLFLHSYGDNRILVYNTIPTENNASADFVIGQVDLNSSNSGTGASEMGGPGSLAVYDGKLFVTEWDNNRVTIFNSVPTENNASADVVVGQEDFNLSASDCTAYNLYDPETMIVVNGKLIITDSDNNRVLIYNTIPTESNASADLVLGQNSFTKCTENDDDQDDLADSSPTARTLYYPAGAWSDGEKLVVNDASNNRVLIWNTFPSANFQPADLVLGQGDFDMYTENDDDQDGSKDENATARTLNNPYDGVFSNGKQLFISDAYNNRILVWNTFPTSNFAPADAVLGQNNFTATGSDTTAYSLSFPTGVYQYENKLIVTDEGNNRYLVFNGQ